MRKLIVLSFITLDGVMQAPGGPEEDPTGGFKHGGWVAGYFDDFLGKVMIGQMNRPYDLLLGRKTYEIFAAHWPYVKTHEDLIATGLNSAKKYVASKTLTNLEWRDSELIKGDVAKAVKKLKEEDGPEIQVHGSGNLIQTLLKHDLVDELRLKIFPITLGTGKRLFAEGTIAAGFKLLKSEISPSGVIIATYVRAGEIKTGSFALKPPTEAELTRRKRLKEEKYGCMARRNHLHLRRDLETPWRKSARGGNFRSLTKLFRLWRARKEKLPLYLKRNRPWQSPGATLGLWQVLNLNLKEIIMNKIRTIVVIAGLLVSLSAGAEDKQTPKGMKTIEPLPRDLEIQLALSALPPHLRDNATVYVLNPYKGFEVARKGTNGFHAFVARTGDDAFRGSWPLTEYRDDILYPVSFDAAGAKEQMRVFFDAAEMQAKRTPPGELKKIIKDRYKTGYYKAPGRAGVSYMVSPILRTYVNPEESDKVATSNNPHVMYYAPNVSNEDMGGKPPSISFAGHGMIVSGPYPFVIMPGPHGYMIQLLGMTERAAINREYEEMLGKLCKIKEVWCLPK